MHDCGRWNYLVKGRIHWSLPQQRRLQCFHYFFEDLFWCQFDKNFKWHCWFITWRISFFLPLTKLKSFCAWLFCLKKSLGFFPKQSLLTENRSRLVQQGAFFSVPNGVMIKRVVAHQINKILPCIQQLSINNYTWLLSLKLFVSIRLTSCELITVMKTSMFSFFVQDLFWCVWLEPQMKFYWRTLYRKLSTFS